MIDDFDRDFAGCFAFAIGLLEWSAMPSSSDKKWRFGSF